MANSVPSSWYNKDPRRYRTDPTWQLIVHSTNVNYQVTKDYSHDDDEGTKVDMGVRMLPRVVTARVQTMAHDKVVMLDHPLDGLTEFPSQGVKDWPEQWWWTFQPHDVMLRREERNETKKKE